MPLHLRRPVLSTAPWRWLGLLLLAAWLAGCASLPPPGERPVSTALADPQDTRLGQLVLARQAADGAHHPSGFRLLVNAQLAYAGRLALIEAAQQTLDLQYYAIHADSSTERLLEAMRDAARRGVRIRILLDDFNTVGPDAQVLRLAHEPGVQIRLFNPLPGSRHSLVGRVLGSLGEISRLQQRMHNKLFIADNAIGITGGRNLGDTYFGESADSNFVDVDVLAAGAIVRDLSASFDSYWNNQLAYPVQALVSRAELDALQATEPATPAAPPPPASATATVLPDTAPAADPLAARLELQKITLTWAPAIMLADKPDKIAAADEEADREDTLVDGLLNLMAQARRDLLIISPYFVPGSRMMALFADLRARGVRIRVLTNSLASNDAPAAHVGYARYRTALLRMGVELYEMRSELPNPHRAFGSSGSGAGSSSRAMLHAKLLIQDTRLLVVGSMNLDLRSQLQNTEIALLIRSPAMARDTAALIEPHLLDSAYRVELRPDGGLLWHAPLGSGAPDTTHEPDTSLGLRLMLRLIAPFAPDELL
ncbi:phospholipase D family protein [Variovorax terrae]|uniref:Phospholipase D family protein n=1 Tax=Variovorax terrae TaxID=2923278 RepID=A0A9X2AKZ4_9BURK|nr:phospholipase D family protein [Variovorax terrae]MCJ0761689.1 phospholipase D family protein [Variovorax terrae]